ncbi:centrosomal protein CEP57L1 isoform X2 [Melanerpes formicivorus]|uniref:centrosomal protein CEP57L1 isoform X2 n=1 Tax=Melanerpes formicivorus TaxID=211600 RepID=UPI00358F38B7
MDSQSENSYTGRVLQPPNEMLPAACASTESKKLAAVGGDRPAVPNSQAVVAALKALQEKIHRLELEKSQAEDHLCSLSVAAAQCKKALECESHKKKTAHQELMQQREDVRVQLNATQSRCSLLEKQLDYMRKMVSSAEQERKKVLEQQAKLQKEEDQNCLELHAKLEKLEMLEKEWLHLTAAQRITELQTGFERNRISVSSGTSQNEPKKGNGKKKKNKKKNATMKTKHLSQIHIKAGELPFVAGKSVSCSHSVSANVQSMLHIMKHRSPQVSPRSPGAASGTSGHSGLSKSISSCSTSPTATGSLSDLLLATQDELGQMSLEHQELLKQLQEAQDSKVREDLEWELNCLVKEMDTKGEQISKLEKHQATVQNVKRKTQELKQGAAHVQLKCGDQKEAKEIVKGSVARSCPGQKSRSSLQLLKTVQKLQSRLRTHDSA